MAGCWETYSDHAHGTRGSATIMATLAEPKPRIFKGQNMTRADVVWEYGQPDSNPYVDEWQVLLDAIRGDRPHNEARRAGEADIVALMGRMATHTGQYVTWEQAAASNFEHVTGIDSMNFDTPAPIHEGPDGIYPAPVPGVTKEI
jgi:hypothetical protein